MGCVNCNSLKKKKSGCKNSNACTRCNKFSVFDWLSNISPPSNQEKCSVIELSFKNGRKDYYSNSKKINIKIGDPLVVKADVGYDIGLVSLRGELVRIQLKRKKISSEEIRDIVRSPSSFDLDIWKESIRLEKKTMLEVLE